MQQHHLTRLLAALLTHLASKTDRERLAALEQRVAALEQRVAALEEEHDCHHAELGIILDRVAALEARPIVSLVETRIRVPRTPKDFAN